MRCSAVAECNQPSPGPDPRRTGGWFTSGPTPADRNQHRRLCTVLDVPSPQRSGPLTAAEPAGYRSNRPSADRLGDNRSERTDIPTAVKNGTVTALATGKDFSAAVVVGRVHACGARPATITVPPDTRSRVTALAAGYGHIVALRDDGRAVERKVDPYGRNTVPADVGAKVPAVAAGAHYSLALPGDPPAAAP
ncbi:hypothetical protein ACH4U3_22010 [Streptomyces griseoruber]|uniref:hypothetical protein n=1 Tax=Streptomyces griseoruber TaxID=1943 RepID=UPI00379B3628